ncbi:tripartite tricarboxylate transporter substrate binding protein [Chelatococcus daeguensis]|uniref:C4-dicarboxylate ABC transporter substrate-binding protein n=2 Tax=Chelatococcus TaxID=28209 RepID=A0AAC9NYZ8_9HYPH|nr:MULTISPECIES: tripartite tricarboxylate transporter substrate binding protein [Chelatococcus]APF37116.1 C4-dicarboxylate ABC transporter substrate-binding protein [Chelatococcus daeguensis]KZE35631.1 C4-dicarboxylate ABC transporter substrate-binding protein [Chelatococcus daeguensis]MBM3084909.1 tripartite tricarboxylate transporter substrate binding protein [Chelatococcus daeguensis]CUA87826.1 Tripartite-type tricarboxylate transporter, receptor component TctC [Chelatococcus sambhunathii]
MFHSYKMVTGAVAALLVAAGLSTGALGQSLELKIMAPAAPGGGWDQTARAMQAALTESGAVKSAQVVNVPGAGGTVGLAQFVNAKGDGSQLMVNGFVMVGAILTNKAPVTLAQTTPIARLTAENQAIVVPANSPIKNAKDLAEALKADPAKVTWAGGSAGGTDHIMVGLFAKAVGVDPTKINYVPFSGGGEALAAILGGKVTAGVSGYGEFEGQIKAGKLRLIGIAAEKPVPGLDAPTLKDQGIDLAIVNWRSVVAPPGLDEAQTKTLLAAIDKMVKSKQWQETLKAKNWDDAYLSGEAFATFLQNEQVRVAEVLQSIGLVK